MICHNQKVGIVILNWNQWEATQACLESLATLDYPDYEVILLDNASASPPPFEPSAICPGTIFIQNRTNGGFGAGNNPGIRKALDSGAEFIWLLNNDTLVFPETLTALVAKMRESATIGAVGSMIYDAANEPRLLARGGGFVNTARYYTTTNTAPDRDDELDYLTAASLLLRTDALTQCGLFDERFFMYWEDVDLCRRLRDHGWRLAVADAARILHHEGKSCANTALKDYFSFCSAMRFAGKYSSRRLVSWLLIIYDRIIKPLLFLRWGHLFSMCKAGLKHRPE